jgi:hypothetical protein
VIIITYGLKTKKRYGDISSIPPFGPRVIPDKAHMLNKAVTPSYTLRILNTFWTKRSLDVPSFHGISYSSGAGWKSSLLPTTLADLV